MQVTYRHVSTRIAIVPAEFFNTFRNSLGGPVRHSGEPAHRTRRRCGRRGRRAGWRPAATAIDAAVLGYLRRCRCRELVSGPGQCLLHRAHLGPAVSRRRPGKHSGRYVDESKQTTKNIC